MQIHVLGDHLDDLLEGPLPLEPQAAVLVVLLDGAHHVARLDRRRLARALEARFEVRSRLLGRGDGRIQRIVGGLGQQPLGAALELRRVLVGLLGVALRVAHVATHVADVGHGRRLDFALVGPVGLLLGDHSFRPQDALPLERVEHRLHNTFVVARRELLDDVVHAEGPIGLEQQMLDLAARVALLGQLLFDLGFLLLDVRVGERGLLLRRRRHLLCAVVVVFIRLLLVARRLGGLALLRGALLGRRRGGALRALGARGRGPRLRGGLLRRRGRRSSGRLLARPCHLFYGVQLVVLVAVGAVVFFFVVIFVVVLLGLRDGGVLLLVLGRVVPVVLFRIGHGCG